MWADFLGSMPSPGLVTHELGQLKRGRNLYTAPIPDGRGIFDVEACSPLNSFKQIDERCVFDHSAAALRP
jgi:hypothetical protein